MADISARIRRILAFAAVPLGLTLSGVVVWQGSYAAFTATTSNPANSWTTGSVTLSDSQGGNSGGAVGTALWTGSTGLVPGSTDTRCIKVTYTGSVAAAVKMYVAPGGLTGTLGPYLRLSIDEGTAGNLSDCSDFGGTVTNLYNSGNTDNTKTLDAFATASSNFATGVSSWQPTGSGQSRTYRITWTVLDDQNAQNKTATAAFTWEGQNT